MVEKRYTVELVAEAVRYRVRFVQDQGRICEFVVQLEYKGRGDWQPVIRYDTVHGFPHCDVYAPDSTVKPHRPLPTQDYNEAFTYAQKEVRSRWPDFVRPFEEARQ